MNVKPNANFSPVNHKQIGSNRLQRARATPGLVVPPESKIKYLVATAAGAMIANALFTADGVLEITKVSVFTVISSGIIVGSAIMLLSGERRIVRIASGICGGGLLALIGSIQGVLASTFGLFFFGTGATKIALTFRGGADLIPIAATFGALGMTVILNRYMVKQFHKLIKEQEGLGLQPLNRAARLKIRVLTECIQVGILSVVATVAISATGYAVSEGIL